MATTPEPPPPDRIDPQSPTEIPAQPDSTDEPGNQPAEVPPESPDTIDPGSPQETPPPPD